jgi:hypothetical protein
VSAYLQRSEAVVTISAHALVRRDQPAVAESMEPSGWHCCRWMPSRDIAIVYDAMMYGPEEQGSAIDRAA